MIRPRVGFSMMTDGCSGGFGSPFTFTGELLDANDLLYLRARHYNSALGVFTALDPEEGNTEEITSLNRYGYVSGNPVNRVDPRGMIGETPKNGCNYRQEDNPSCNHELTRCQILYLAHSAASEASGTEISGEPNSAAIAGLILSMINGYKRTNYTNFDSLEVMRQWLYDSFRVPIPDPGNLKDPLGQQKAYRTFLDLCEANGPDSMDPSDPGHFITYPVALEMAEKMTCIDNPLNQLDQGCFGITASEDVDKLKKIAGTVTFSEEKGFSSTALDMVPQWREEQPLFVPDWLSETDKYVIFRGDQSAVIIYDVNLIASMHVNWLCPQVPGERTNYAVFSGPRAISARQCWKCDPGSGVWHPGNEYLKRCEVDGKCRGYYDDGSPIPFGNDLPCRDLT
jgi:RHS repeat-associated protein